MFLVKPKPTYQPWVKKVTQGLRFDGPLRLTLFAVQIFFAELLELCNCCPRRLFKCPLSLSTYFGSSSILSTCLYMLAHCMQHFSQREITSSQRFVKLEVKLRRVELLMNLISELWDITCLVELHSATCHPTQVNTPHLNPSQRPVYSICLPPEGWKAELSFLGSS